MLPLTIMYIEVEFRLFVVNIIIVINYCCLVRSHWVVLSSFSKQTEIGLITEQEMQPLSKPI